MKHDAIPLMEVDAMFQWRLSCVICGDPLYRLRTGAWRHHPHGWTMNRYPEPVTALARGESGGVPASSGTPPSL